MVPCGSPRATSCSRLARSPQLQHFLPFFGLRWDSVSTFCRRAGFACCCEYAMVTVYGRPALEGTNGIIDTTHPGLALHWNQSMLASLMICWANSIRTFLCLRLTTFLL